MRKMTNTNKIEASVRNWSFIYEENINAHWNINQRDRERKRKEFSLMPKKVIEIIFSSEVHEVDICWEILDNKCNQPWRLTYYFSVLISWDQSLYNIYIYVYMCHIYIMAKIFSKLCIHVCTHIHIYVYVYICDVYIYVYIYMRWRIGIKNKIKYKHAKVQFDCLKAI